MAGPPSPAMVVALVALSSSLASGAMAAKLLTGKDIANRSITGKDLRASSVTSKHVKNRSLVTKDFKQGHLLLGKIGPVGPEGPEGPEGARGPAGADGVDGADGAAGADGVDGAAGADGVDGADGADGAPGPPGGNVIASGFHTLGSGQPLASGNNDFFAPTFAASASGVCLVAGQVVVDNQGASANNTASIQTLRRQGGTTVSDGGWNHYVMADGDSEGSATKTTTFDITDGSSYELGVRVFAAGDSVGDLAFPTVTYFCL
jgi:hypothetical protein